MHIDPVKPFFFMIVGIITGLFPLAIVAFFWWIIVLLCNASR